MIARLVALLCVMALAAPGAALAQGGGAFDPIPPAPPPAPPTTQAAAPDDDDEGLTSTQQLLIGLSAFALLFGIGWVILRDARTAAPADARPGRGDEPQRKGSQTPAGVRHRQNRAKAKAARRARKKARRR